jgi:DNA polymerase-2
MTSAFLLTRQWRDTPQGVCLELWWASDQGPIFTQITHQEVVFFARREDTTAIHHALGGIQYRRGAVELKTFNNEPVDALYFKSQRASRDAQTRLTNARISFWESDIRPPERYLMERFITATAQIESPTSIDKKTFTQLINPRLRPLDDTNYRPELKALSVDIETSMDASQLYSIACFSDSCSVVFMVGEPSAIKSTHSPLSSASSDAPDVELMYCTDAKDCLIKFIHLVAECDPDVLIGWNFVQFDCWVLEKIAEKLKVKLTLGRNNTTGHWRQEEGDNGRRFVVYPGRVALDGIELLKAANHRFASYSLANVSHEILQSEKLIASDDRGEEITRLFKEDKPALAQYNLQDTRLVWDIFSRLSLIEFAMARSQLTGLLLDRIGGSVAAFEYLYLPRLHRKGYIAPNLGEREIDVISPGGYVMNSRPGLYDNVLVLDFKSLYPSIMRTFLIDPCAFWLAEHDNLSEEDRVQGFNGASFAREGHVLPDVVASLSQAREQAKMVKDDALSHAIKIIMNSFYGVLGSNGCRFCDPRVSSSITLRGHEIIQRSKQWIETQGYQVIYGDTDSLFVWLENNCQKFAPKSPADCNKIGARLARELNSWWKKIIKEEFLLTSYLEIQFETHYQRFLMPTIRGSELGTKKRYAGYAIINGEPSLVFKGLESVRTDWTPLAKRIQETLYAKIFKGEDYHEWVREQVEAVKRGDCDHELIYRKRLRRPLFDYVKNIPPQVQAARKWFELTGHALRAGEWISYVITTNGPEPLGLFDADWQHLQSSLNYDHYIAKQIVPVVDSILHFSGESLEKVVNNQLSLFD